ncbi:MAG TPA: beta-galactosidase [Candidatus Hydrogenedentes bacterium]|nr:beta-galactosidase [Candidatus Hydrogenedentota bacterium]HOL76300.1 beta-galactosidase [Candidatus Hydrogenedentota bacterium]HPO86127.1 beta-galactosidase [Candidatus Hydrogenedentota bacterium]
MNSFSFSLVLGCLAWSYASTSAGNEFEAKITQRNGMPVLLVDGTPTSPLVFFFNTETGSGQENLAPQVEAAAKAGLHIFSMPFDGWHWDWEDKIPGAEGFEWTDGILKRFLERDPDACFIPRLRSQPPWNWPGGAHMPDSERYTSHAGELGLPSIGSDLYWGHFIRNLRRFLRHYEQSPFANRFLGYHIGGLSDMEWFQGHYRQVGPDYSEANQRAFRSWLQQRYGTDEALSRAWGRQVTLDKAQVPAFDPDRFPIRMQWEPKPVRVFYKIPEEQDWIDYSAYVSDKTADRILEAARAIKEETHGRKLSVFFYGYTFELVGSISGHNAAERVLASPDVDILVAPISYISMEERLTGGAAAAMGAVDSVALHGKIWLNEDDMRTHLISKDELPQWLSFEAFGKPTSSLFETQNLLSRNLGYAYVHRGGTWWMDLIAAGAFDDPTLWQEVMAKRGFPVYRRLYDNPQPYRPEVAVVVDEKSWNYVRADYDVVINCAALLRNQLEKTGASIGYYYLGDFVEGKVPPAKVYVFPNFFFADDSTLELVKKRLDNEQATALWQYAPAFLGPAGVDARRTALLTGIPVQQDDGVTGSNGEGRLEGLAWGWTNGGVLHPRLVISDDSMSGMEVLGRYRADRKISAARALHGSHKSVLFCDMLPTRDVLRRIFKDADVHLWASGSDIVRQDGRILILHSREGGERKLRLPARKALRELDGTRIPIVAHEVVVRLEPGETRWFEIIEEQDL